MQKIREKIIYELCIETTKILNNSQAQLRNIKWTDGEANIDTEYSELACNCCRTAWELMKTKYPIYKTDEIICKIPDINIEIFNQKYKIELKSSKSKKMTGSTIKKLDINQPLIYCLRPSDMSNNENGLYQLRCSQYHVAMGESNIDLFQDRTPRPFINFEKMNEVDNIIPYEEKDKNIWVEHYAKCALNRIVDKSCQNSWQDDMVKIMKQKIIDEYIINTSREQFHNDKVKMQL
jgi:hypothetical protein